MKIGDKIAICLGTLDVAYVFWMTVSITLGALGIRLAYVDKTNFGMPFSTFEIVVNGLVYSAIAACGVALVLGRHRFVWLNYLLLPVRILLVIPTLYPVFMLLAAFGYSLSPSVEGVLLVVSELVRCVFVFWWKKTSRRQSNVGTAAQTV